MNVISASSVVISPAVCTRPPPFCRNAPSRLMSAPAAMSSNPAFEIVTVPPFPAVNVFTTPFIVTVLVLISMPPAALSVTNPSNRVSPLPDVCVKLAAVKVENALTLLASSIVTAPRAVLPTAPWKWISPSIKPAASRDSVCVPSSVPWKSILSADPSTPLVPPAPPLTLILIPVLRDTGLLRMTAAPAPPFPPKSPAPPTAVKLPPREIVGDSSVAVRVIAPALPPVPPLLVFAALPVVSIAPVVVTSPPVKATAPPFLPAAVAVPPRALIAPTLNAPDVLTVTLPPFTALAPVVLIATPVESKVVTSWVAVNDLAVNSASIFTSELSMIVTSPNALSPPTTPPKVIAPATLSFWK